MCAYVYKIIMHAGTMKSIMHTCVTSSSICIHEYSLALDSDSDSKFKPDSESQSDSEHGTHPHNQIQNRVLNFESNLILHTRNRIGIQNRV